MPKRCDDRTKNLYTTKRTNVARRARPALFENCNYFKGFFMLNSNAWHINTHTHTLTLGHRHTHTHSHTHARAFTAAAEAEIKTTRRRHIEVSSAARGLWGGLRWAPHEAACCVCVVCVCMLCVCWFRSVGSWARLSGVKWQRPSIE